MVEEDDSLQILLNKLTNPLTRDVDPADVDAFCQRVNKEADGSQTALRILAHKIQSPQEREALQALMVLEETVNKCGTQLHSELGKFRFLNELIKVVSPKYLGNRSSPKVKQKIIEVMFKWSIELKHEPKISEAYQMLKRQGVATQDPTYVLQQSNESPTPPPPRARNAVFEDEEKSQLLQQLLRSRNPEDLQAANRLIKNMVKEADRRMELMARRNTELETVHNNAKVLGDMLRNYRPHDTSSEEKDLMKELFESCERLRPKLFRLAGEMDEKDEGLEEILKANDELTAVINQYRKLMGLEKAPDLGGSSRKPKGSETSLLDLGSPAQTANLHGADTSLLDDQLLALGEVTSLQPLFGNSCQFCYGLNDPPNVAKGVSVATDVSSTAGNGLNDLGQIFPATPVTSTISSQFGQPVLNANAMMPNTGLTGNIPTGLANTRSLGISETLLVNRTLASSRTYGPLSSGSSGKDSRFILESGSTHSTFPGVLQPLQVTPSMTSLTSVGTSSFHAHGDTNPGKVHHGVSKGLEELDELGQSLLRQSLPANIIPQSEFPSTPQKIPLNQMQKQQQTQGSLPSSPLLSRSSTASAPVPVNSVISPATGDMGSGTLSPALGTSPSKSPTHESFSLTDVFIPLETIQPGTLQPLTIHEKNGLTTVIHFGRDAPRADITVMVVSTMSKNPNPVKNVSFQAAVPKCMKIKLQPPSATDLPGHNPILPPAAITQVMLLANPQKERVRLKYRVTYTIEGRLHVDVGESDNLLDPR